MTEETWGYLKEAVDGAGGMGRRADRGAVAGTAIRDEKAESEMGLIMDMVRAIRNARAEYDVKPGRQLAASITVGDPAEALQRRSPRFVAFAGLDPARLTVADRPTRRRRR